MTSSKLLIKQGQSLVLSDWSRHPLTRRVKEAVKQHKERLLHKALREARKDDPKPNVLIGSLLAYDEVENLEQQINEAATDETYRPSADVGIIDPANDTGTSDAFSPSDLAAGTDSAGLD